MNVAILGPQGSGKTLQAQLLSEKFGIPHISMGEILRRAAERRQFGLTSEMLASGDLIPSKKAVDALKYRFRQGDCNHGFVLDGFPRMLDEAEALDELVDLHAVIFLQVPDKLAVSRLLSRTQCASCGAVYGKDIPTKKKGFCDLCSGRLVKRKDDTAEKIRKRLKLYHEHTEDLIVYYRPRDIIYEVDASKSIKEVFIRLVRIVENLQV